MCKLRVTIRLSDECFSYLFIWQGCQILISRVLDFFFRTEPVHSGPSVDHLL